MKPTALLVAALLLTAGVATGDGDENLEEVASPLVSEVAVSPVIVKMMAGAWWHDRSAAHQVVEDAMLKSLGFSTKKAKKKKGVKRVTLMVRAEVASRAYIQEVDEVNVELFDAGGQLLASKKWREVSVGREVGTGMSLSSSKYLTLEHELSEDALEALFADGGQPVARVTITEVD
jgi:hypothetical protein